MGEGKKFKIRQNRRILQLTSKHACLSPHDDGYREVYSPFCLAQMKTRDAMLGRAGGVLLPVTPSFSLRREV